MGAGVISFLEMYTIPPPPGFRILLIGAPGVSVVNFPKSMGGSKFFYP